MALLEWLIWGTEPAVNTAVGEKEGICEGPEAT